jgi:hypothetical protein
MIAKAFQMRILSSLALLLTPTLDLEVPNT